MYLMVFIYFYLFAACPKTQVSAVCAWMCTTSRTTAPAVWTAVTSSASPVWSNKSTSTEGSAPSAGKGGP